MLVPFSLRYLTRNSRLSHDTDTSSPNHLSDKFPQALFLTDLLFSGRSWDCAGVRPEMGESFMQRS